MWMDFFYMTNPVKHGLCSHGFWKAHQEIDFWKANPGIDSAATRPHQDMEIDRFI